MQVEAGTKEVHTHCAALDMPTGTPLTPGTRPKYSAVFRHTRLPKGEIGNSFLFVLVIINARIGAHFLEVQFDQLAVLQASGAIFLDAEIDRAILCPISQAAPNQLLNQSD